MIAPSIENLAAETPPPGVRPREWVGLALLGRICEAECLMAPQVASWHDSRQILQARRWHRRAFAQPLELTPLEAATEQPCAATLDLLGRDISLGGLSFLHPQPLPYRKAAITFPELAGEVPPVVVRLTWCRFTRDGVYQSGGPFLRLLETVPLS